MNESIKKTLLEKIKGSYKREDIIISICFFVLISILFIYLNYQLQPQTNPFINRKMVLGQISIIIALSLIVTYFYAFRFFNKPSYFFICLGWGTNALYLLFEFFFNDHCFNAQSGFCGTHAEKSEFLKQFCADDNGFCLKYSIGVYLFSLLSTVAFYIAASKNDKSTKLIATQEVQLNRLFSFLNNIPLIIWLCISVIPALAVYFSEFARDKSIEQLFFISSVGGMAFTAYSLIFLGYKFQHFLSEQDKAEDEHGKSLFLKFFPYTFYIYGLMQFTYPFKIYLMRLPEYELNLSVTTFNFTWLGLLFITASGLKLLNVAGMMTLLLQVKYHDYIVTRQAYFEAQNKGRIAQLELENTRKLLYQRNNLATLGVLSASIEHDLKTPLANLKTDIETIKRAFPNNSKLKVYLENLENDKNRIFAIARVIPFIRASGNYYNTDKFMDKISVTAVMNLAIKSVKTELNLDTQKFFFRNKNKDYYIRAFSPMIEQIFVNIFKNSIEAIRDAGKDRGVIDIEIGLEDELPIDLKKENKRIKAIKKWVRVKISDNGCGIAKENILQLTTLYTSKDKPNGGVGLYMAKKLLKIHDSLIYFQSKLGEGTSVSVFFPEWDAYKRLIEKGDLDGQPMGGSEYFEEGDLRNQTPNTSELGPTEKFGEIFDVENPGKEDTAQIKE